MHNHRFTVPGLAAGVDGYTLACVSEPVAPADTAFDRLALPSGAPLTVEARAQGTAVLAALEVMALRQFMLHTGMRP